MKLASTTADFRVLPIDDHIERVRHIAKAGFRYIDLSFYTIDKKNSPFLSEDWEDYVNELIALADELGIKYVQAHLPGFNPLDEEKFEDYCRLTIRSIEVCGRLGIENAVFHVGWKAGISKEEFFYKNHQAMKPLFPAMEKNNVNVLVENSSKSNMCGMYYLFTGKEIREFIDYVGHPLVKACWDTGHANMDDYQYENIMDLGDYLHAIHVHDNNGRDDEHIAPFQGTLNMDELVNALIDSGYKGYFTFEADTTLSYGNTSYVKRHTYSKDTRLFNPNLDMYDAAERFLFEIGKAVLNAYEIYEE